MAWLSEVDKEGTPHTFADEAEAVLGNRGSQRAVGRINQALSRRLGARWPGTELVVHTDGRVAGNQTLAQAVKLLRKRGIEVRQIGSEFYIDLPEGDES